MTETMRVKLSCIILGLQQYVTSLTQALSTPSKPLTPLFILAFNQTLEMFILRLFFLVETMHYSYWPLILLTIFSVYNLRSSKQQYSMTPATLTCPPSLVNCANVAIVVCSYSKNQYKLVNEIVNPYLCRFHHRNVTGRREVWTTHKRRRLHNFALEC